MKRKEQLVKRGIDAGYQAMDGGDFDKAREYFEQVRNIDPGNVEAKKGILLANYREQIASGHESLRAKAYVEAAQQFQEAARIARDDMRDADLQREAEYYEGVAKGRYALENDNFVSAQTFFKKSLEIDDTGADARTGYIESLYKAGQQAESDDRLDEARDYYRALLEFDKTNSDARVRLNAVDRLIERREKAMRLKKKIYRILGSVAGIIFLAFILAQVNQFIAWPLGVCNAPGVGGVLCTPSPTPTATSTPTPTPTFTPTPTSTPTCTPTPTNTPTATPTATPTPLLGRVLYEYVTVFTTATGNEEVSRAARDSVWHLCAKYDHRYLVAQDYCFKAKPLGWIKEIHIEPLFVGQFPPELITPTPSR